MGVPVVVFSVTHLDLFSGIAGFALAARWTGKIDTVAFCEIDPFCRLVIEEHFRGVPIHGDARTFRGDRFPEVDIITGGFPCQDVASANRNATGLQGKRSGLWYEMFRIIAECRPRYVVIENVRDLRRNGLNIILSNLTDIGYDAEWHSLAASEYGACHKRERVFAIAYPGYQPSLQANPIFSPERAERFAWHDACRSDWRCLSESDWSLPKSEGFSFHDGLPSKLDSSHKGALKAYGNAIDPRVAYPIMMSILEVDQCTA